MNTHIYIRPFVYKFRCFTLFCFPLAFLSIFIIDDYIIVLALQILIVNCYVFYVKELYIVSDYQTPRTKSIYYQSAEKIISGICVELSWAFSSIMGLTHKLSIVN